MKRILILSCKVGEGHNAAAKALAEQIEHRGDTACIVDFLGLSSKKQSELLNSTYIGVVTHIPYLFGTLYGLSLSISIHMKVKRSPFYRIAQSVAPKLQALLEKEGFDGVIATHMLPAMALTHLKKEGYPLPPTVAVSTDYTCYPFWEEIDCDHLIIAHKELTESYVKRGIPKEKLRPCGIPISMRFSEIPTQEDAKQRLGFDTSRNLYLIMGGSMGAGHLRSFTRRLHKSVQDADIAVICGKNETLRRSLEKRFADCPNVRIIGFTTEVAVYMAACDVLYTKPGGLTSTEALACKTPTVHTAPIPGCESDNFRFFGDNGLSMPAKRRKDQLLCGKTLAENHNGIRDKMLNNQAAFANPNAASDIIQLLEEKAEVC